MGWGSIGLSVNTQNPRIYHIWSELRTQKSLLNERGKKNIYSNERPTKRVFQTTNAHRFVLSKGQRGLSVCVSLEIVRK